MFDDWHDKLNDLKLVLFVIFLSPLIGGIAAVTVRFTGSFWADLVLFTVLPYGFWFAAHQAAEEMRAKRFGPDKRDWFTIMDLFVAVGLTLVGFIVVTAFGGKALAERDAVNITILAAGCLMCGIPFFRVVRAVLVRG